MFTSFYGAGSNVGAVFKTTPMLTFILVLIACVYAANALFVVAWMWLCVLFGEQTTTREILTRFALPFYWLMK